MARVLSSASREPSVIRWLHALDPERSVNGELLRASVRYSTALAPSEKSQPGMPRDTASLFIPMYLRNTYVLGQLCGPMSPNILALANLEDTSPPTMPRSRRFVVDLATTNPVEFVEYEWMQDGKLCVSLHEITEAGLYSGQTIIFDGPTAPGSPVPSRVSMRLHYKEVAIPGKPKARLPAGWRDVPSSWESWVHTFALLRTGPTSMHTRYAISPPSPNEPQFRGEKTTLLDEECAIGEAGYSNTSANKLVRMFLQMNGMMVGNPATDNEIARTADQRMFAETVNGLYDDEAQIYDAEEEPEDDVRVDPNGSGDALCVPVPPQPPVQTEMGVDITLEQQHQQPELQPAHENGTIEVPPQEPAVNGVPDENPYPMAPQQPSSGPFTSEQFVPPPLHSLPPPPPELHAPEPIFPQQTLSSYSAQNSSINGSQSHSLPPPGFPIGASSQLEGNTGTLPPILLPGDGQQSSRGTPSLSDHGRTMPVPSISGTESIGSSRLQQPEVNKLAESPRLTSMPLTVSNTQSVDTAQSPGTNELVSKPMPSPLSTPILTNPHVSQPSFETPPLIGHKTVFQQAPVPPSPNSMITQPATLQPLLSRRQPPPLPVVSQPSQTQPAPPQPAQIQKVAMPQPGPPLALATNQRVKNEQLPSMKQRPSITPENEVPTLRRKARPAPAPKGVGANNKPVALPASGGVTKPQSRSNKREHLCECGKYFAHRGHFNAHRKAVHEKIRSHKCTYRGCDRAFAKRGDLLRHQLSQHAEDVRYSCSQCNVRFPEKKALEVHISEVHDQDRPYKCPHPHCTKSYSTRSGLRKHNQTKHEQGAVPQQMAEAPAVK